MDSAQPKLPTAGSPILNLRSCPPILWLAIFYTCGIICAGLLSVSAGQWVIGSAIWLMSGVIAHRFRAGRAASCCLLIFVLCLGGCRWRLRQLSGDSELRSLADRSDAIVMLHADICSVPAVHVRPTAGLSSQFGGSSEQTRFEAECVGVSVNNQLLPIRGRCYVYVEGNAARRVSCGDRVRLLGRLHWPSPPTNPGEFDFASFLNDRQIAAQVFVRHPDAMTTLQAVSPLNPRYWLSLLRTEAQSVLTAVVDDSVEGVALALMLGERNQIPADVERAFVASGTMHLLAISGLHVGILCLFVLRLCNLLLLSRRRALWLTLMICASYAFVTDLRPSVVRASVFFALFVAGELTHRRPGSLALIAFTVLIMLAQQPELAFDTGAWLSFLSVFALTLVDTGRSPEDDDTAPPDALTFAERMHLACEGIRKWLRLRYSQMLAILAFTTPLIAMSFHVVSPIGLFVNVVLIPVTAIVLCLGFVTLLTGILLPWAAGLPGAAFSAGLKSLTYAVTATSSVNVGHVYVPDLSPVLVCTYYLLVVAALLLPAGILRKSVVVGIALNVWLAIVYPADYGTGGGLRCTVLNVGHGNAAVLEFRDGRVLLVDAGAMRNGSRAADLICGYLWSRGYRTISGIIISHADADHYNAVPEIVQRIPVGELICSRRFTKSASPAVQRLLLLLDRHSVPIRTAGHRDVAVVAGVRLTIHKARQLRPDASDNEASLVLEVEYGGRRIILPGDIEGGGADQVLPTLNCADVLVSPHHGAVKANSGKVAQHLRPQYVIVSSRDTSNAAILNTVYSESHSVRFTSRGGAITVEITADGTLRLTEFCR